MHYGFRLPPGGAQGRNPAAGVAVYYWFKEKPKYEVTLEFLESASHLIRKFSSNPPPKKPVAEGDEEEDSPRPDADRVPAEPGLNRFVWNLRYPAKTSTCSVTRDSLPRPKNARQLEVALQIHNQLIRAMPP